MNEQFNAEDFIEASKQIEREMEKAFNGYKRSTKGHLLYNEPKGKKRDYFIELNYKRFDKQLENVLIPRHTTLKEIRFWFEKCKREAMFICKIYKGYAITGVLYNKDKKELDAWCVR